MVYSDWLERKCGTSTWILQISWFVGLPGPQTPEEGYLTLIFIQAEWRWHVEHRLEYFKSADGYLWQYLYGNVSLMIRVHKGHISMPGSRGPLFTFHSYFLLFFSLLLRNQGPLDPNSNLPPKIIPLDFFKIHYLKQDKKLGDVKNWQHWNMYTQCAVTFFSSLWVQWTTPPWSRVKESNLQNDIF